MRIPGFALLLLLPANLLMGQVDTITITSARTVYIAPDQAVLGITLDSMTPVGLDEALAALQGSGITTANLSGTTGFQWSFTVPVAFSQLSQMLAALGDLKQSVQQKSPGFTLAFGVVGTQISTASQQSQPCGTADLLADARQQAQKLANVAGLTLGPVVSLGNAPTPAVVRFSSFLLGGTITFNTGSVSSPPSCSLTVTFKIIRTR